MEHIGKLVSDRVAQIIVENEMLRAGFAAFPYVVLRDTRLTAGARLTYAVLLMYAWQEGSCFPGQQRMAQDMGVSERHLRRFLDELRDHGYIKWRRTQTTNVYHILDVATKLRRQRSVRLRTPASDGTGQRRPPRADVHVRQIDAAKRPNR